MNIYLSLINSSWCFKQANNMLSLTGIPFMGSHLKIGRPSKYRGPAVMARTWQSLTGQPELSTNAGAVGSAPGAAGSASGLDPSTKIYRELYVGNTTPNMTEVT